MSFNVAIVGFVRNRRNSASKEQKDHVDIGLKMQSVRNVIFYVMKCTCNLPHGGF
jgi:hypothetical protein